MVQKLVILFQKNNMKILTKYVFPGGYIFCSIAKIRIIHVLYQTFAVEYHAQLWSVLIHTNIGTYSTSFQLANGRPQQSTSISQLKFPQFRQWLVETTSDCKLSERVALAFIQKILTLLKELDNRQLGKAKPTSHFFARECKPESAHKVP